MAFSLFFSESTGFSISLQRSIRLILPIYLYYQKHSTCPEFISLSQALAKGFHSHLPHTYSISNIKLILTIFQHSQTNIWINILSCQHIGPPIIAPYQSTQHTKNFLCIYYYLISTQTKKILPKLWKKSNIKKIRPAAGQIAAGLVDMALSPNTVSLPLGIGSVNSFSHRLHRRL